MFVFLSCNNRKSSHPREEKAHNTKTKQKMQEWVSESRALLTSSFTTLRQQNQQQQQGNFSPITSSASDNENRATKQKKVPIVDLFEVTPPEEGMEQGENGCDDAADDVDGGDAVPAFLDFDIASSSHSDEDDDIETIMRNDGADCTTSREKLTTTTTDPNQRSSSQMKEVKSATAVSPEELWLSEVFSWTKGLSFAWTTSSDSVISSYSFPTDRASWNQGILAKGLPPTSEQVDAQGQGNGGSGCMVCTLAPLRRREEESGAEDLISLTDSIVIKCLVVPLAVQQQQQQQQENGSQSHDGTPLVDADVAQSRCEALLNEIAVHAALPVSDYILPCYGGGVALLSSSHGGGSDGGGDKRITVQSLRCLTSPLSSALTLVSSSAPTVAEIKTDLTTVSSSDCLFVFFLMERAVATLATQQTKRPSLPSLVVVDVLRDVLSGLKILHHNSNNNRSRGTLESSGFLVIHGDMKPQNVYLRAVQTKGSGSNAQDETTTTLERKQYGWCLADFGCAVCLNSNDHYYKGPLSTSFDDPQRQTTNAYPGTVLYMAPEVAAGAIPRTVQSDVWSVGVLAVWLATGGEVPWPPLERQIPALLLHQLRDSYRNYYCEQQQHSQQLPKRAPLGPVVLDHLEDAMVQQKITLSLGNVVRRCFAMDPSDRPTVAEFLSAL